MILRKWHLQWQWHILLEWNYYIGLSSEIAWVLNENKMLKSHSEHLNKGATILTVTYDSVTLKWCMTIYFEETNSLVLKVLD